MSARVIAIANQKGGVGKTTTALNLGAALALLKKRVLVIDLDPHANASVHLSFFPETLEATAYDLFQAENADAALFARILKTGLSGGFDFVPGHIRLSELEVDLKDRKNKGLILSEFLAGRRESYDYVLLDCPPHVGILLVNAIVASDMVLIPIQTDFLALYGIRLLFDTIRLLNRVLPKSVHYMALPTMYDQRTAACRRILRLMRDKLGNRVFETVIHFDTKFRESSAGGKVVFEVDAKARGAVEYLQLAKEIDANENA
ncbi:ParA family protein [Humidesulfovibrio sp.]